VQRQLDRNVSVSRRLGKERELSFYGNDDSGVPPEELYSQADAEAALGDADFVVQRCARMVKT
jgi:HEPN domain-containing protein